MESVFKRFAKEVNELKSEIKFFEDGLKDKDAISLFDLMYGKGAYEKNTKELIKETKRKLKVKMDFYNQHKEVFNSKGYYF